MDDWQALYEDSERRCLELERRLNSARCIPAAARHGWFVCCIVDSTGYTISSLHVQVQGGDSIPDTTRREVAHHLQTHHVRGVPPVRYVMIPITADLCTIGPEVRVWVVEPAGVEVSANPGTPPRA